MQTTRRGFLKGGVLGSAAAAACAKPPRTQTASHPEAEQPGESSGVELKTTVNGTAQTLRVGPDESTLELLRERLGLTGCKLGCGHGACGACAIQLDGEPVASCLLPAVKLEGRKVTTVEQLGAGSLHPIQRAFWAEDALQCGYCTPGFVVEAAAFFERWRATHGTKAPTREQVAAALSGHLCRCGAYPAIFRAVIGACSGEYDGAPEQGPRVDALAKLTGQAKYTVDVAPAGVLIAKVLRSPHAHATVRAIDWSAALALPGVHGALELTRVGHKVRFVGQEVVALAAVDAATALEALHHVRVDYELLPAAIGIDAALEPGAARVYDNKKTRKRAPNANETPLLPETWDGNLRGPFELFAHHAGRARRRIAAADEGQKFSASFRTQTQAHTALEPHAAVAEWLGEDSLRVHVSSQAVLHIAEGLAHRFGLRRDRVEVRSDYVGGGFGAKAVAPIEAVIAVELARICGRPVKLVNDRREELAVGGSRPGLRTELTIADDGGQQPAIAAIGRSDAGVAVGSAAAVMFRIHQPQADLDIVDYDVLNHAPPGTPFRGPGGPPAYFALEQGIDALAQKRGVDPLALRRRFNQNENRERVFAWAEGVALWRDRPPPQSDKGRFRRGVGLASASWLYIAEPATRVQIDAGPEGIVVSTACQDIGNGSRTILADTVAGVLGVEPHTIRVEIGSSRAVHGPISGGSRTATSLAPAAIDAATELREELVELARTRLGLREATPVAGGVEQGGVLTRWTEVLELAPKITTTGKRGRDKGGFFLPPIMNTAVGRYLSAGVQITEVEVDTRLGRVRVLRTHGGYSVGTIYSPILARSQAEGAIVQGIGYALYEERRLDPRHGSLLTGGLEDYRLCGLADVGEIEVEFLPGGFENVRGKGVGVGELCTLPVAAAIANAVHHATGWRPTELPLRPDRVLEGVRR
ncbi:MAG: molybdopterin-dependent oxidoreductase [Enhygromyxa sp.]